MMDEGYALSQMQVVENVHVVKSNHATIHSDGTSCARKKNCWSSDINQSR